VGEARLPLSTLSEFPEPPLSTWEDLVHEIYIRQAVEAGLADSQAGRTTDVEQVRSSFGLSA
jgi:hypothetical protein